MSEILFLQKVLNILSLKVIHFVLKYVSLVY